MKNSREEESQQQQPEQQQAAHASSRSSQDQLAALYGPPGHADHRIDETITFASADTNGQPLTGKIIYVRAPGPAIVGGRNHPTVYFVFVEGETFPRVYYPGDVIER
jgi:hypothetical protein